MPIIGLILGLFLALCRLMEGFVYIRRFLIENDGRLIQNRRL